MLRLQLRLLMTFDSIDHYRVTETDTLQAAAQNALSACFYCSDQHVDVLVTDRLHSFCCLVPFRLLKAAAVTEMPAATSVSPAPHTTTAGRLLGREDCDSGLASIAMTFSWLQDNNPFVVPAVLLAILLFIRKTVLRQPSTVATLKHRADAFGQIMRVLLDKRSSMALLSLLSCVSILAVGFEYYFRVAQCAVSSDYHHTNIALARTVIGVLVAAQQPYWLDYATLLSQLRGQSINTWDHDADLSMVYPGTAATLPPTSQQQYKQLFTSTTAVQTLEQLFAIFTAAELQFTWVESRDLVQIWSGNSRRGPHIDIWLWTAHPAADNSGIELLTAGKLM